MVSTLPLTTPRWIVDLVFEGSGSLAYRRARSVPSSPRGGVLVRARYRTAGGCASCVTPPFFSSRPRVPLLRRPASTGSWPSLPGLPPASTPLAWPRVLGLPAPAAAVPGSHASVPTSPPPGSLGALRLSSRAARPDPRRRVSRAPLPGVRLGSGVRVPAAPRLPAPGSRLPGWLLLEEEASKRGGGLVEVEGGGEFAEAGDVVADGFEGGEDVEGGRGRDDDGGGESDWLGFVHALGARTVVRRLPAGLGVVWAPAAAPWNRAGRRPSTVSPQG